MSKTGGWRWRGGMSGDARRDSNHRLDSKRIHEQCRIVRVRRLTGADDHQLVKPPPESVEPDVGRSAVYRDHEILARPLVDCHAFPRAGRHVFLADKLCSAAQAGSPLVDELLRRFLALEILVGDAV